MFIIKLDNLIDTFEKNYAETYVQIIHEELSYSIADKLGCPTNKMDIILYNLIPFIQYADFEYNLRFMWLISLEIKLIILKILKNKKKIITNELKNELTKMLFESYIKNNIVPEGLIQIIVSQWVCKIKV